MKQLTQAFFGALLVFGLASVTAPAPTFADGAGNWDPVCNCRRPDSEYQSKRVVRGQPVVRTHRRVVNHQRVVRGKTRLIQENRLIVHVRPVINKEVVVHRTHTVVKDVVLHKTNTTNKYRNVYSRQVVNVKGPGTTRHVVEHRRVRGVDCNCDDRGGGGVYQSGGGYRGPVVSYRY